MRRDWKLFLDQVNDFEDALQRMATMSRQDREDDLALAATDAADHLLALAGVLMRRGDHVRVPEVTCG